MPNQGSKDKVTKSFRVLKETWNQWHANCLYTQDGLACSATDRLTTLLKQDIRNQLRRSPKVVTEADKLRLEKLAVRRRRRDEKAAQKAKAAPKKAANKQGRRSKK